MKKKKSEDAVIGTLTNEDNLGRQTEQNNKKKKKVFYYVQAHINSHYRNYSLEASSLRFNKKKNLIVAANFLLLLLCKK